MKRFMIYIFYKSNMNPKARGLSQDSSLAFFSVKKTYAEEVKI